MQVDSLLQNSYTMADRQEKVESGSSGSSDVADAKNWPDQRVQEVEEAFDPALKWTLRK